MFPSGSMSALISSPHWPPFMLFGSVGQPSTKRYGLGRSGCLGYSVCWARATGPKVAATASTAISVNLVRPVRVIGAPLSRHSAAETPRLVEPTRKHTFIRREGHTYTPGPVLSEEIEPLF